MSAQERSLREVVHKWFGRAEFGSLHVSRVANERLHQHHCVRVDLPRPGSPITVFFFRHQDGGWAVFPPTIASHTDARRHLTDRAGSFF